MVENESCPARSRRTEGDSTNTRETFPNSNSTFSDIKYENPYARQVLSFIGDHPAITIVGVQMGLRLRRDRPRDRQARHQVNDCIEALLVFGYLDSANHHLALTGKGRDALQRVIA